MSYRAYAGPLELVNLDRPSPKEGQVLVRARFSSVNPIDWKVASGKLRFLMPVSLPAVPGYDIAGEVEEVGPNVSGFQKGDRVHARINGGTGRASAEYALVGIGELAKVPEGMELDAAAALPLAGMTALQGLRDEARMPMSGAKERVLIVGASGGVGHLAVQIARAMGAHVTGVCSGRNAELVSSLGAHEVIDYTKPNAFEGKGPFDVVLDCVAGKPGAWTHTLVPKGRYASCLPGPAVILRSAMNFLTSRRVRPVLLKANAADLKVLDALVEKKALRVVIDSRYGLSKLEEAWARSKSGRATGKIVIAVDE